MRRLEDFLRYGEAERRQRAPGEAGEARWRTAAREHWERFREEDRRRGWTRRGRELARRFRDPLIGLALVGATAPLASQAVQAAGEEPGPAAERARRTAARAGGRSLEEDVGRRWAELEAERTRRDTIEGAMLRYGISRSLATDIYDHAVRAGIEPELAYGLVKVESRFKHRAVSHVGARGLTQLMPATARWLEPGITNEDLFDRHTNLRLGFSYLRDLIDKYDGNVRLALLAYNRGPGTVDRVLRQGGDPDNGYADLVLEG